MDSLGILIDHEHANLVAGLESLTPDQWNCASLCSEWTNRDVVAHLVDVGSTVPPRRLAQLIVAGFRVSAVMQHGMERVRARRNDQALVEMLRGRTRARWIPTSRQVAWLGEIIIHGEDVFRPLNDATTHDVRAVVAVAQFYAGRNAVLGVRHRIQGVRLIADDTEWHYGDGLPVTGPAVALLLAITGRAAGMDELSGPGVSLLAAR